MTLVDFQEVKDRLALLNYTGTLYIVLTLHNDYYPMDAYTIHPILPYRMRFRGDTISLCFVLLPQQTRTSTKYYCQNSETGIMGGS